MAVLKQKKPQSDFFKTFAIEFTQCEKSFERTVVKPTQDKESHSSGKKNLCLTSDKVHIQHLQNKSILSMMTKEETF